MIVRAGCLLEGVDAGGEELGLGLVIGEDPSGGVEARLHGVLPQELTAQ